MGRAVTEAVHGAAVERHQQRHDVIKLLLLIIFVIPFFYIKVAKGACSALLAGRPAENLLPNFPCDGSAGAQVAHIALYYKSMYMQLLNLKGGDFWITAMVWLELASVTLMATASARVHTRYVMPAYACIVNGAAPLFVHAYVLLSTGAEPTLSAWEHIRLYPLLASLGNMLFPVSLRVNAAVISLNSALGFLLCLLCHHLHPTLELNLPTQLLTTAASAAGTLLLHLWRDRSGRSAAAATAAAAASRPPGAACSTAGPSATPLPKGATLAVAAPAAADSDNDADSDDAAPPPPPPPPLPLPRRTPARPLPLQARTAGDPAPLAHISTPNPSATPTPFPSLRAFGLPLPLPARQRRRYVPLTRRQTLHIKLEGVSQGDLPPEWRDRLSADVAVQTGGALAALYVRDGCIELVADIYFAAEEDMPVALQGGRGEDRELDIESIVAALGLDVTPSSITVHFEPADGGGTQPAGGAAAYDSGSSSSPGSGSSSGAAASGRLLSAVAAPPRIMALAPRVLLHSAAAGTRLRASLHLPGGHDVAAALSAPGGLLPDPPVELLVRAHGAYLAADAAPADPAAAGAAGDFGLPQQLRRSRHVDYHLHVRQAPPGPGLLLVDCRPMLLSGVSRSWPVVVVDDSSVAMELQGALEAWDDDRESLDALLLDLGLWLESLGRSSREAASSAGAGSRGRRRGGPAVHLGAQLLQHACLEGWVRTARWLMRDLQAAGVQYSALQPRSLLIGGSPGLLQAALGSCNPAMVATAAAWELRNSLQSPKTTTGTAAAPAAAAAAEGYGRASDAVAGGSSAGDGGWANLQCALLGALGLARAGAGEEDEASFRAYASRWVVLQGGFMLLLDLVMLQPLLLPLLPEASGWRALPLPRLPDESAADGYLQLLLAAATGPALTAAALATTLAMPPSAQLISPATVAVLSCMKLLLLGKLHLTACWSAASLWQAPLLPPGEQGAAAAAAAAACAAARRPAMLWFLTCTALGVVGVLAWHIRLRLKHAPLLRQRAPAEPAR